MNEVKVFIVDDELHIRERLKHKIEWQSFGIDEVKVFDDGDLALAAFIEESPDILLTDIRMPRMDGISLSREVLKMKPDTRIILMSAFDDKHYLKSAIDLRVIGYIEKPFDIKQLKEFIKRAQTEIRQEEELHDSNSGKLLQIRLQECSEIARTLSRFQHNYESVVYELEQINSEFLNRNIYTSVLIHFSVDRIDAQDQEMLFIYAKIYQFLKDKEIVGVLTEVKKQYLLVHLGASNNEILTRNISEIYNMLSEVLSGVKIHIAVGTMVDDYKLLYQSYQEVAVCIERHFFYNAEILFADTNNRRMGNQGNVYKFNKDIIKHFAILLEAKEERGCYALVESLRADLKENNHTLVRSVKNYYFQLILLILSNRPSKNGDIQKHSDYYLWETIFYVESLDKLHEYVVELLDNYFVTNVGVGRYKNIDTILKYIHDNYANPELSLTEIARVHYMSVPYLCMFFKESTDKTIKSYLIDYRMEKAVFLLMHSELRIAEIAERTGFSNQNYFTKRFSKYYGQTPTKYKEIKR